MKKHKNLLKKKLIYISLLLLSPEIYASLNFNYDRDFSPTLNARLSTQVKTCHTISDPIKISLILADVDTLTTDINLKINGKAVTRVIVPFKENSGVARPIATSLGEFISPFTASTSGELRGSLEYYTQKLVPTYFYPESMYCFNSANFTNNWGDVGGGKTFGLHPLKRPVPGSRYTCDGIHLINGGHFDYDKDLDEASPDIKAALSVGKDKGVDFLTKRYFYKKAHYMLKESSHRTSPLTKSVNTESSHIDFILNKSIILLPPPPSSKPQYTSIDGRMNFYLSSRNIQSIDMTITKGGKSSSLRWIRADQNDVKTMNILSFTLRNNSGLLKTATSSYEEDLYFKYGFYTRSDNKFSRGTLVSEGGLNEKYHAYVKDNTPLSLPANADGNINLVSTDSIIIYVKGQDNKVSGKVYTAYVYGQPLKFSNTKYSDKVASTAETVRNACY